MPWCEETHRINGLVLTDRCIQNETRSQSGVFLNHPMIEFIIQHKQALQVSLGVVLLIFGVVALIGTFGEEEE